MSNFRGVFIAAVVGVLAGDALGQPVNYDFGSANSAPSSSYGAGANQPGIWNSASSVMLDVYGQPTAMKLAFNGWIGGNLPIPSAAPDDRALMEDYTLGFPGDSMTIKNVVPGKYRLYLYMWGGLFGQGAGTNGLNVNVVGSTPSRVDVKVNYSAAWPGGQVLGNTFNFADIELTNTTFIDLVPLGTETHPSIFQGFQLIPIPAPGAASLVPLALLAARRRR